MAEVRLDAADIRRTLGRMAHQILEYCKGAEDLVVVGVLRRGFPVAKRLAFSMTQIEGVTIPCGSLDVRAYRDDLPPQAEMKDESEIPFSVEGKTVLLVDEVIQTGRTIRAALDALFHHGRPKKVLLAVLIDRDARELPIQPDFVGKYLEVSPEEKIEVRLGESESEEAVVVTKGTASCIF
ncbi:MAG TPA: bifunctional pyr operon transcriptional regulator/uracil phosphoribosyltransferase PyrR [Fimbriimonadales bacterium]|nr:bifunctional pyr operon transcriptional regulator/uracil phosphoribosyltransferase PyrR [Fimbriimonadales bacterium]